MKNCCRILQIAALLSAAWYMACLSSIAGENQRKFRFMNTFTDAEREKPHVQARSLNVPQNFLDGQWGGIIAASNGKTYFGLSAHSDTDNAQFYSYDPKQDRLKHIIDVGRWCGEDNVGAVNSQGKIHSWIYEADGKLYMSSTMAHKPEGYPYKGGHFLSYDLKTGKCEDLGRYEDTRGGLLTMLYEPVYRRLYAIAQGDQTLVYYDIKKREIVKVGSVEDNAHHCRTLISDRFGNVYGSTWAGMIYRYNPNTKVISSLLTTIPFDPKAPQPQPNPARPMVSYHAEEDRWKSVYDGGQLAWHSTHWVPMVWDPVTKWWYGVRGNDEYLFRFRPPADGTGPRAAVEGLVQFGFRPSEQQPRFASMGMCLKDRTLYYCSYPTWRSMAHLMSYNIDEGTVTDHGPIVLEDGRRVSEIHALVTGSDGNLHAAAMVWSIEGKDPANDWGGATRASCYIHCRLLVIDPTTHFKNADGARRWARETK